MKLTEDVVKKAEPKASGRRVITDNHRDAPRGFALVIRKSGGRAFALRYKGEDERDRLLTIGEYPTWTLKAARDRAQQLRRQIDAGEDPLAQRERERTAETIEEVTADFLETKAGLRSHGEIKARMDRHVIPALGRRKIRDVGRRDITKTVEKVAAKAPRQATLTLTYLKQVFEYAEDREIIDTNPAASLKPRRISAAMRPRTRSRILTDEEIRELMLADEIEGMIRPTLLALRFILVTGQRPGEVIGMAWSELDGDLWTIPPARRGKTDTAHSVPITPKAQAILEELRERDSDHTHVFATRTDTVPETAALARALTRAYNSGGLAPTKEEERWRPHDLRRTMRTGLAAAGISDTVAEAAVGHTRKGIAAVYDRHTYDAEKRAALEAWEKRLDAIMSRKTEASNEAAQTLPS